MRAVGGLTTGQIAQAYLVPESTMAQRISRAKRTVADVRFTETGDLATVRRVLYLVFNEGYTGDVDLAAEAIRLTRQLASITDTADDPETAGLLALMLLQCARRPARTRPDGSLVPLAEQDRSQWDTSLIAEGVAILQTALARDRLGEFQAQAAIAALHADAPRAEETDWVQIVSWYDELLRLTGSPVVELNRAIAIGEADGATAGLAALAKVDPDCPATPPRRRICTRRRATRGLRRGCTPKPPSPPPTWPNATTWQRRQRGSIRRCGSEHLADLDLTKQERLFIQLLAPHPGGHLRIALAGIARSAAGHHIGEFVSAAARDRRACSLSAAVYRSPRNRRSHPTRPSARPIAYR